MYIQNPGRQFIFRSLRHRQSLIIHVYCIAPPSEDLDSAFVEVEEMLEAQKAAAQEGDSTLGGGKRASKGLAAPFVIMD